MTPTLQHMLIILPSAVIVMILAIFAGNGISLRDYFPELVLSRSSPQANSNLAVVDRGRDDYRIQIFSKDPLIIYIRSFLSQEEIDHVMKLSEGKYETSKVYPGEKAYVDASVRVSESALIERDSVVRQIEKRAISFQGWRGKDAHIQPLKTQRYGYNGYFSFHYDWDPSIKDGNRVTTFMIYLVDDCIGGGTNFPRLQPPADDRWCDVIVCDEDERDGYDGVIFKPVAGSAVFWENMHPNGSFHRGVRHASLPVRAGEKVGLNIWTWDSAWREPSL